MVINRRLLVSLHLLMLVGCGGSNIGNSDRNGDGPTIVTNTPPATADNSSVMLSQIHRSKGSTVLTVANEIEQLLASTAWTKYRTVPDIMLDDEGTSTRNVNFAERPSVSCGNISRRGINDRMTDCSQDIKNGARATWNGEQNGAAGEALWLLVFNDENKNLEIWLDNRTGLVWTSKLDLNANWCQASGNDQDRTISTDPLGIDCSSIRLGEDRCRNLVVDGLNSSVVWRLPTRNDFLQADLDGMRFVLSASNEKLWTSTLVAGKAGRDYAWAWNTKTGVLSETPMMNGDNPTLLPIRCVGAPSR